MFVHVKVSGVIALPTIAVMLAGAVTAMVGAGGGVRVTRTVAPGTSNALDAKNCTEIGPDAVGVPVTEQVALAPTAIDPATDGAHDDVRPSVLAPSTVHDAFSATDGPVLVHVKVIGVIGEPSYTVCAAGAVTLSTGGGGGFTVRVALALLEGALSAALAMVSEDIPIAMGLPVTVHTVFAPGAHVPVAAGLQTTFRPLGTLIKQEAAVATYLPTLAQVKVMVAIESPIVIVCDCAAVASMIVVAANLEIVALDQLENAPVAPAVTVISPSFDGAPVTVQSIFPADPSEVWRADGAQLVVKPSSEAPVTVQAALETDTEEVFMQLKTIGVIAYPIGTD